MKSKLIAAAFLAATWTGPVPVLTATDWPVAVQDSVAHAQVVACPPICPPPPPAPAATDQPASNGSGHGWKAGKFFGTTTAIGIGVSATALIARTIVKGKPLTYGEGYCTAEFGLPLVLKPLRMLGDLKNGELTPLDEIVFCPEQKLDEQYARQTSVGAKVQRKHRKAKR